MEISRHMDMGTPDLESIAARFVDVHGIRRAMEKIPIASTCQSYPSDEAAVVKATPLENHSNAGERSTLSLLPEADRMSRLRQFPDAEAEKRAYSNRLSAHTEEEIRLLGGSGKNDPEAVSIAKPKTRHDRTFAGTIPKGPQPRNTLSGSPFSTGPAVNRKPVAKSNPRGRSQQALVVEIHKGSNVNSISYTNERHETLPSPPSAKRRKLDHQVSSESSGQTDPLDKLSPHAISFHASQGTSQAPSRAPSASANSYASGFPTKRHGSSEYRSVEAMMDSKPKRKKQREGDNQKYQADFSLLPSSPKRASISTPIDISGDESQFASTNAREISRSMYRGTARQPLPTVNGTKANTSKPLKERAAPTQSPHFSKPGLPAPQSTVNVKQKSVGQNSTREKSPGLAQKFVAADGTRRGSDVNASSDADELHSAPTTVGQNADPDAVFTTKDMRSSSPSKHSSSTLKATSSTDEKPVLAPSTVKSDFAGSTTKSLRGGRSSSSVLLTQEIKPPWSVALAAISLPGRLYKNEDLGLVYDEKQREYHIRERGERIESSYSSLRIQPPKLLKVSWEKNGVRVRFESSRSGTEDNVLDLELTSERDVQRLLRQLQDSKALTVGSKTSEQMKKIFERRRSELRGDRPEEVTIATYGRRHNDSSKFPAISDTDKPSRQRPKSSIVNELVHDATHDTPMAAERPETRMSAMPNGLPEARNVKNILAKLKPAHNEHLNVRRSSRNSGLNEGESLLSSLDGIPQKEKYSVKYGLGDPWKKPLTYPKVGKKKTTVEWSDLERLDEGEFLNDNLISFYLRYLEQRLEEERPGLAKRVYFFNTFFFATLTNTHKGRKRFNYEGVQKWTRSVDLFTYDYIIVPINEQAHWYLAIICNLPALDHGLATDEAISSPEDGRNMSEQGPGQAGERASRNENQPDGNESDILPPNVKEPNERDTRNSFSQLSLENHAGWTAGDERSDKKDLEKAPRISDDKEMLDTQIEDTMPEYAAPKETANHKLPSKRECDDLEDPIEDQDESPKAAAKSKKSKRKSMPAPITKLDPRKPAIITFDSLGQTRSQTIRILKDYLIEEAKSKRGMEFEESQMKGINAKRIPQQDNYSDCGVFLLGYVDTFLSLETDPREFITKTIQQTHEAKDWSKLVPGDLRANIRNQVQELHKIQNNERREESAKNPGKLAEKEDKKLVSSPSRAPHQAKLVQKEAGGTNGADSVPAATINVAEPSLLEIPRTRNEALETAFPCDEEGFDGKDDVMDELLQSLQSEDRAMQKSAEYQRLYNGDDVEMGSHDGESPAAELDDPSAILVDSQSQRKTSAPRDVTNPSFSSAKQCYPESTSSRIVSPTPLPFEKKSSPELPSEIPDSQNSNTSQKITKILNKSAPLSVTASSDPAPVSANLTVISDSTQGLSDLQGDRNERSKRRRAGREDREEVQNAAETEDMVFTIERPSERREERKEPSKRRKTSAKDSSKDFEEVQYHVIDD